MIETLEDSIAAWDQGRENTPYEDTTVTTSPYTTSCPQAPDITINNAILSLGTVEAIILTEEFLEQSGSTLIVAHTPIDGFDPQVFKNGIIQRETTDWLRVGTVFTFTPALSEDDVFIRYAYEV